MSDELFWISNHIYIEFAYPFHTFHVIRGYFNSKIVFQCCHYHRIENEKFGVLLTTLQLKMRSRSNSCIYCFIADHNASPREHIWQLSCHRMDIKWREASDTPSRSTNLIQDSLDNMPRLSIGKALLILLSCDERDFNVALSKQNEYSGNFDNFVDLHSNHQSNSYLFFNTIQILCIWGGYQYSNF